jgi:hypothetical protein
VRGADLRIDPRSAKTVINLDLLFIFSQNEGEMSWVSYSKTHKNLKELSRKLGLEMPKIKYLDRET